MRFILITGTLLATAAALSACGQKGSLYVPKTPAAQQRATLPQTVFGGARPAASAASSAQQQTPPMPLAPALPDQPDSPDSQ